MASRAAFGIAGLVLSVAAIGCGGGDDNGGDDGESATVDITSVRENLETAGFTVKELSIEQLTDERIPILPGGFDTPPEAGFQARGNGLESVPTIAGYAETADAEAVCADYEGTAGACQVEASVVFYSGNPEDVDALVEAATGSAE